MGLAKDVLDKMDEAGNEDEAIIKRVTANVAMFVTGQMSSREFQKSVEEIKNLSAPDLLGGTIQFTEQMEKNCARARKIIRDLDIWLQLIDAADIQVVRHNQQTQTN